MNPSKKLGRRKFFTKASLLGAGLAAAAPIGATESARREPNDVFRIGCLNVSTYSHLPIWAPLINPRANQKEARFTGMRITHCWEIDHEKAKAFARNFGCEAVKNFDDMLGKVDGIISGGYYNHPWNHILHEPYLEAGLPNLINRPFSNSLAKAKKMIETAQKHGATILVPSSLENTDAAARAKQWATGRKIVCYIATNSFDDYPTHGIHGVYWVCKTVVEAGNPIVSVSYKANSWYRPPAVLTYEHVDKDGQQFFGSLHQTGHSGFTIRMYTPGEASGEGFDIPMGTGYPYNKTELWAPTLWAFERMARYGDMPQSFDQLLNKNNVFLAGWRSILENDGKPVRLEEVPEEWETPVELPSRPNDNTVALFRKQFGPG